MTQIREVPCASPLSPVCYIAVHDGLDSDAVASTCIRQQAGYLEIDTPAEIDRAEVELSPLHPASPSKRHGSPRHHGSPQLSRRGPDAAATDHQARGRMVWGPSTDPSDSQIAPHAMQRAMQCSTAQSLDRCGFGFAFGLKSGMGRRGEVLCPQQQSTACLPHASPLSPAGRFGLACPGWCCMLRLHSASVVLDCPAMPWHCLSPGSGVARCARQLNNPDSLPSVSPILLLCQADQAPTGWLAF